MVDNFANFKQLQDDLEGRRREMSSNPLWTGLGKMLPYLLPLLSPLIGLLLLLSLGPMLFNKLMAFIRQQIEALQSKPIQVPILQRLVVNDG